MTKKRTLSLAVIGLLALTACGLDVGGVFTAKTQLTFIHKALLGTRSIVVPAGTYNADVYFNSTTDNVELRIDNVDGHNQRIKFKAPTDNVPLDGTWVDVSANQSEQPYDTRFSVLKDVKRDPQIHQEYEHCTYQRCYDYCHDVDDGHGHHHQECNQQCQNYDGRRYVEYYFVHTYWDVACKLGTGGSYNDASFKGKRHDVDRDYTYQGSCY